MEKNRQRWTNVRGKNRNYKVTMISVPLEFYCLAFLGFLQGHSVSIITFAPS